MITETLPNMAGKINGFSLAAIGAGSLFVWSGIKGWSITGTIGDVILGHRPNQSLAYALTSPDPGGSGGISGGTASQAANDALKYQGHLYKYGGAPGRNGQNPWDCSSFANWVFGHDMGAAIPGYGPGRYDGSVHGPPTGSWAIWPGLQSISAGQVQAGDIIIWPTHMGIAISNTHMVSAVGPDGTHSTKQDPIHGGGPRGESVIRYGRYR